MTSDEMHSAIQEIIAYENKDKKNHKLSLSTPTSIVTWNNGNSEIQQMKDVVYQNNEIDAIVLKIQILDYFLSIEND